MGLPCLRAAMSCTRVRRDTTCGHPHSTKTWPWWSWWNHNGMNDSYLITEYHRFSPAWASSCDQHVLKNNLTARQSKHPNWRTLRTLVIRGCNSYANVLPCSTVLALKNPQALLSRSKDVFCRWRSRIPRISAAKSHKTALIAILCYTPKICLHAILFKSFRVSFQANNSKEHNLVSEGWHCHFQTKYVLQVLLPQDVRETLCIFQHKANVALRATATVVAFMKLWLFTMFAHYGIAKNECSVDPEDLSICECHRHFSKMLHPQNPIRSN